jgi:hypothetical protein
LAPTVSAEYVHRWFVSTHPSKDEYSITILRYEVAHHRTWCLMPSGMWREVPVGTEMTPWLIVPGGELNPFVGRPDFRALVETSIRTCIAPRLEQLQVELNWMPMHAQPVGRTNGKSFTAVTTTATTLTMNSLQALMGDLLPSEYGRP